LHHAREYAQQRQLIIITIIITIINVIILTHCRPTVIDCHVDSRPNIIIITIIIYVIIMTHCSTHKPDVTVLRSLLKRNKLTETSEVDEK